ncbi:MAG TPA: hypothetical protein VKB50_28565 [Vicinamibacterales bacterium]|nr:hypothetical protein [Vicinamibacterales bacterium]
MRERSVGRGLAGAATGAVITLVAVLALRSHSAMSSGSGVAWIVAIGFFVAFAVALIVGLPIHLMFRRFGVKGLVPYLLAGLAAGLLLSAVEAISFLAQAGTAFDWRAAIASAALLSGPCGVVGAAVFWALVVRTAAQ